MRKLLICVLAIASSDIAAAQCINRSVCDPSTYEVRSQLNVTVQLTEGASPADTMKAMDEAQHRLSELSQRELDAVKSIYGADAALRASNTSSNMQDNPYRGTMALISVSNTYAVKKPADK